MSYSVNASFGKEQAKLEGSGPIEMYVVNASLSGFDPLYYVNYNQNVYGYGMDASSNLQATEVEYIGFDVKQDSFKTNTEGDTPEITLSVPNVDRTMEAIIQDNQYLRGRSVHLLKTFSIYLPSGSDYRYIGTTPDKNAFIKEKLYIDSVSSNESTVEFRCKPKFVLRNVVLPKRRFLRTCEFEFGGDECDPAGSVSASWDSCNKSLEDCKERRNEERFGGFPSLPRGAIII